MENQKSLTLLREAYLMLQRLSRSSVSVAIETDELRASLRNHISDLTGDDCESIQTEVESIAFVSKRIKL